MSLRNIFLKLAHDVSRYPNIVQLTNTLDHGFKEVAAHIQDGGSEVEVTPVYTSGEKLATITVDDVDNEIYMPNGEVKTMEGSSFKTVNGSLVDEMKVGFTPIQDLHGYSKPWAGGAGKNQMPLDLASIKTDNSQGTWSDNVYTISSLDITVNVDSDGNVTSIKANGTPSADVYFNLVKITTLNSALSGSYTLNGCPSDGNTNYRIQLGGSGADNGSGYTGSTPFTGSRAYIFIKSGYTSSNLMFYPMLRLASVADPTFEPYSNICPISGHTQVQSKINNTTYTTSLGDTYYDGDVEQVGGTGEYIQKSITFDGSGDETWENAPGSASGYSYRIAVADIIATPITASNIGEFMCNEFSFIGSDETFGNYDYFISKNGNLQNIVVGKKELTTLADFKTWLSNNPLQVVYKLATPTALTLTGQNITAEVGENNVSAPGANQEILEVKYHQMMTIQDVEKLIQ